MDTIAFYGKEKISKILLKLAPPVMLAQLIQAPVSYTHLYSPARGMEVISDTEGANSA